MFLPDYKFDQDIGYWVHREEVEQQQRIWLGEIDYSLGHMELKQAKNDKSLGVFPFIREKEKVLPLSEYSEMAMKELITSLEWAQRKFSKWNAD